MPSCFFSAVRSVRHTTKIQSAMCPRLVHTFCPLMTHSSPSRTAVRLDVGEVGAGVGLTEALAPELLRLEDRRQEPALLLLGAEHHERRARAAPRRRTRCGCGPPARTYSSLKMISWVSGKLATAVLRRASPCRPIPPRPARAPTPCGARASSPSPSSAPPPNAANSPTRWLGQPVLHLGAERLVGLGEREIHAGIPPQAEARRPRAAIERGGAPTSSLKRPVRPRRPTRRTSSRPGGGEAEGQPRSGTLARETHDSAVSSQNPMAPCSWWATRNTTSAASSAALRRASASSSASGRPRLEAPQRVLGQLLETDPLHLGVGELELHPLERRQRLAELLALERCRRG